MNVLFYGDSITDAGRERNGDSTQGSLGVGFVRIIASKLSAIDPNEYRVINRGIGGDRIVSLYARIKKDCWNLQPDVLTILIGINDVWHETMEGNGVELPRFEKVYKMLLEDTKAALPNTKIILIPPFVLETELTKPFIEEVSAYAKVVKQLAEEFGTYYLPLQSKLDEKAKIHGVKPYLSDGVHPFVAGSELIANEWMKLFEKEIINKGECEL